MPSSAENVPASHERQVLAPPDEKVPAGHGRSTLVPSHAEPAKHSLQVVRVVLVPPEVKEPPAHVEHSAALFELKRWSDPHSVQLAASGPAAVPARHGEHDDAPPSA